MLVHYTVFSEHLWTLEGQMLEQKLVLACGPFDPLSVILLSATSIRYIAVLGRHWVYLGDQLTSSSDFHCCYHGKC